MAERRGAPRSVTSGLQLALALTLLAGPAAADEAGTGPDFGLRLRGEYDSNLWRASDGLPDPSDVIVSLQPFVRYRYGEPDEVLHTHLAGWFAYQRYTGADETRTRMNELEGAALARLCAWGRILCVEDQLARLGETRATELPRPADLWFNHARLTLGYGEMIPGDWGRLEATYGYALVEFGDDQGLDPDSTRRHTAGLSWRMQVLPTLRLGIAADFAAVTYPVAGTNVANVDANPLRAWLELRADLPAGLTFAGHVGYGDTLVKQGDSYRSGIGGLALTADLGIGDTLTASFARDFGLVPVCRYQGINALELTYRGRWLGDTLGLDLGLTYEHLTFGRAVEPVSPVGTTAPDQERRKDHVVRSRLGLTWVPWPHVALGLRYDQYWLGSDFRYTAGLDPTGQPMVGPKIGYDASVITLQLALQWDGQVPANARFAPLVPLDTLPRYLTRHDRLP